MAVVSVTTTAALPLSYIATTSLSTVAVPSTGIGRCRVTDCWPCTSSAGLNDPIVPSAGAPTPADHDREGRQDPLVDTVGVLGGEGELVGARPTPTAYSKASLLVQLTSTGSPFEPTASGFNGISLPSLELGAVGDWGGPPGSPSMPEFRARVGEHGLDEHAHCGRVVDRFDTGPRTQPSAIASMLPWHVEHAARDAGGLGLSEPRREHGDPARATSSP